MKRGWWGVALAAAMLLPAAGAAPSAEEAAPKAASSVRRLKVKKIVLGVRHRVFHEFGSVVETRLNEEFRVGDSEYTAKVLRFVPHFTIDDKTRRIVSLTNEPKNPAFQIVSLDKGVPHDTTWAFVNFPPHFSKRAILAYQVLRIEFDNHPPVMPDIPADSSAAAGSKAP
jgi:hypothetical protein